MLPHIDNFGRYAEYMLQGNILAIRFMKEPTDYSYSWTVNSKETDNNCWIEGATFFI